MFRLECITTCLNYADFLFEAAKVNKPLFDRWIIITKECDSDTREVCRKFNLECLTTEAFDLNGTDEFAKAKAINRGIDIMSTDCWRLHLDADMVLPPTTRHLLEIAHLDETCIYGIDRVMCPNYDAWAAFLKTGFLHHDYGCRVNFPPFPMGERWASPFYGWVPLGAFQLAHSSSQEWRGVRQRRHPDNHNSGCRTDIQNGLTYDRRKRVLIPEIVGIHLSSEPAKLGANWQGRTTKKFGHGPFGPHHHKHPHKPPHPPCPPS